ncbi:hypothetical protein PFISCL1PPCAC_7411, partial [Pristionchus fissidentatus]
SHGLRPSDLVSMVPNTHLLYTLLYLTLSVAVTDAVIIEEQWVAVKDWFARFKRFITTPASTTTTTTPSSLYIPRGTLRPLKQQESRLHLNKRFRGEGCEVFYRELSTDALVPEEDTVYEPRTYESGHCSHHCYTDKYTGKWVCCLPTRKESVELFIFKNGSSELRIRSVDNVAIVSCGYL